MLFIKRRVLSLLLLFAVLLFPNAFPLDAHAASSVYIPGVPGTSQIGISCNYGGLGAGTVLCTNNSPVPIVTCSSGTCSSSAGYQNRLMFVTPGSYGWNIPSGVTKVKAVVIGAGGPGLTGTAAYGAGGGGYSESTITVTPGQAVTVVVQAGGSGLSAKTKITVNGVTINAAGGDTASASGGCGSGGNINTCGGTGGNGGGGAGGPYANGGSPTSYASGGFGNGITGAISNYSGQYGGYGFGIISDQNPVGANSVWWDPRDIMGNGGTGGAIYRSAGGLGAGGGAAIGNGNVYAGTGGFGGGGGAASSGTGGAVGGNAGIGAGGGCGWYVNGGNWGCWNFGTPGSGIAIIYW